FRAHPRGRGARRERRLAGPGPGASPLRAASVEGAGRGGRELLGEGAGRREGLARGRAPLARVLRAQVSAARARAAREKGRRKGQGRLRGRAGARAGQGPVRPVRLGLGLQQPLPQHHPRVQHLLHHRRARAVRGGGRRGRQGCRKSQGGNQRGTRRRSSLVGKPGAPAPSSGAGGGDGAPAPRAGLAGGPPEGGERPAQERARPREEAAARGPAAGPQADGQQHVRLPGLRGLALLRARARAAGHLAGPPGPLLGRRDRPCGGQGGGVRGHGLGHDRRGHGRRVRGAGAGRGAQARDQQKVPAPRDRRGRHLPAHVAPQEEKIRRPQGRRRRRPLAGRRRGQGARPRAPRLGASGQGS
ncbi:hypothetical protein H632_c3828p0, partial [Helicosporidium sp. ATCC 50920]